MKQAKAIITSEKVTIHAPASVVWQVLTDLEKYPEWNPFTVQAVSNLKIGSPIDMTLPKANGKAMTQREYIKVVDIEKQLSWGAPMPYRWILEALRDQYIAVLDENTCTYFTTDSFWGLLTNTVMKQQGLWVKNGFDSVAFALKQRAESLIYREET